MCWLIEPPFKLIFSYVTHRLCLNQRRKCFTEPSGGVVRVVGVVHGLRWIRLNSLEWFFSCERRRTNQIFKYYENFHLDQSEKCDFSMEIQIFGSKIPRISIWFHISVIVKNTHSLRMWLCLLERWEEMEKLPFSQYHFKWSWKMTQMFCDQMMGLPFISFEYFVNSFPLWLKLYNFMASAVGGW